MKVIKKTTYKKHIWIYEALSKTEIDARACSTSSILVSQIMCEYCVHCTHATVWQIIYGTNKRKTKTNGRCDPLQYECTALLIFFHIYLIFMLCKCAFHSTFIVTYYMFAVVQLTQCLGSGL